MIRADLPRHARRSQRSALGWATALLLLVSCDRVIGLREGYYSTTAGVGGAGVGGGFSGTFSRGGEAGGATVAGGATNGGRSGGSNGGNGGGGLISAGNGGSDAGVAPIGDAGSSSGGAADGPLCADHPITAEATWVPSASPVDAKYPPSSVTDGAPTRWSTGRPQAGGEWLQIDFGAPVSLRRINLQQGPTYSNDYPRQYAVVVSDTNEHLTGTARATGVGVSGVTTTIVLPQVFSGRYLLIEQQATSLSWWSVEEIEVSCYDD